MRSQRPALVPNPPWVTAVVASAHDRLATHGVPSAWLPLLSNVEADGAGALVTAEVKEYGCGQYGCVLPTHDPRIVLKVTTDDTEAQFAGRIANALVRPICVRYYSALEMDAKHRGHTIYLLWRESAERVGEIYDVLAERNPDNAVEAYELITRQHEAAQNAYKAIFQNDAPETIHRLIAVWLQSCEVMARQTRIPELRALGDGLVEVYADQHVFFGDIHDGNLGLVRREDGERWVITDPGHVAVVDV